MENDVATVKAVIVEVVDKAVAVVVGIGFDNVEVVVDVGVEAVVGDDIVVTFVVDLGTVAVGDAVVTIAEVF